MRLIALIVAVVGLADAATFPGNPGKVETAIDLVVASGSGALDDVVASLVPLSEAQLDYAYDQMHPALYKGMAIAMETDAVLVRGATNYRFRYLLDNQNCVSNDEEPDCCEQEEASYHIWADGVYDFMKQSNINFYKSNQVGYRNNTGGVIGGIETHFFKVAYAGAFGAYTHNSVTWEHAHGKGNINTGYGGLYLAAVGAANYFNLSFMGGWSGYDAERRIEYPGMDRTAKNRHNGAQAVVHFDTGNNNDFGGFSFRPYDSVDFIFQSETAFTETGAGSLNLNARKTHSTMVRNELGFNWAVCRCAGDFKMNLDTKFAWVREVRVTGKKAGASFVDTDEPFTVIGYFPDRNLVSVGASYAFSLCNDMFNFILYYNGLFATGYGDNALGGQLNCGF